MKTENIKIKPKWTKSKEDIWNERFSELTENTEKHTRVYRRPIFLYTSAAAILLIIILPAIAFFYSKEIVVPRGQHYTLSFPDGSQAIINAESNLSYKPFWWKISRDVKLNGEAFFMIEKGRKFEVYSTFGTITVLGTSFNVLARSAQYNVACLSGKVRVQSSSQSVILTKGMQTVLERGLLQSENNDEIEQKISWTNNKFVFNKEPLINVIGEIERQYNIEVITPENINYIYSGNFTKLENPEEVLQIIQEPFGIELKIEK